MWYNQFESFFPIAPCFLILIVYNSFELRVNKSLQVMKNETNSRVAHWRHHRHERRHLTGGVSPDVSNPLMDAPIHIDDDVELIVEDIFNIPSPHMTPKKCCS